MTNADYIKNHISDFDIACAMFLGNNQYADNNNIWDRAWDAYLKYMENVRYRKHNKTLNVMYQNWLFSKYNPLDWEKE